MKKVFKRFFLKVKITDVVSKITDKNTALEDDDANITGEARREIQQQEQAEHVY